MVGGSVRVAVVVATVAISEMIESDTKNKMQQKFKGEITHVLE